jgi:cytoskeletal protein CcmA (bactofilin family)
VFNRTINGTARTNLKFAIGSKFGVAQDGTLYAGSAVISGSINATSGTIGKCSIDASGNLKIPTANITGTITANAIDLGDGVFSVTTGGALTATNATIEGSITANYLTAKDSIWLHGTGWSGYDQSTVALVLNQKAVVGGFQYYDVIQLGDNNARIWIPGSLMLNSDVVAGNMIYMHGNDPVIYSIYNNDNGHVQAFALIDNYDSNNNYKPYLHVSTTEGGAFGVNADIWSSDISLKK